MWETVKEWFLAMLVIDAIAGVVFAVGVGTWYTVSNWRFDRKYREKKSE